MSVLNKPHNAISETTIIMYVNFNLISQACWAGADLKKIFREGGGGVYMKFVLYLTYFIY